MPVFITEMVARGFWWAILAWAIVGIVFIILGWILKKIIAPMAISLRNFVNVFITTILFILINLPKG